METSSCNGVFLEVLLMGQEAIRVQQLEFSRQDHFSEGWISVGSGPTNTISRLTELTLEVTGSNYPLETISQKPRFLLVTY